MTTLTTGQALGLRFRFTFKKFQREDYARAALHDGVILAHDTGVGKGLAAFVWTALKCGFDPAASDLQPAAPVLIVAPGEKSHFLAINLRCHLRSVSG
jgi:hypothetical protein